jgi:hypothetical protein
MTTKTKEPRTNYDHAAYAATKQLFKIVHASMVAHPGQVPQDIANPLRDAKGRYTKDAIVARAQWWLAACTDSSSDYGFYNSFLESDEYPFEE